MCTENQVVIITKSIAELARETFGEKLRSVILYGSYARGDYDEESDMDIMILVDLPMEELRQQRQTFTSLTGKLGLEYNIVIVATLKDTRTFDEYLEVMPFYQNVEREGIKIAV